MMNYFWWKFCSILLDGIKGLFKIDKGSKEWMPLIVRLLFSAWSWDSLTYVISVIRWGKILAKILFTEFKSLMPSTCYSDLSSPSSSA